MLQTLFRTAYDSGAEVQLYLTSNQDLSLRGVIQDLDETHMALFHSGVDCGMRWVIRLADVATCALITRLPDSGDCTCGVASESLSDSPDSRAA